MYREKLMAENSKWFPWGSSDYAMELSLVEYLYGNLWFKWVHVVGSWCPFLWFLEIQWWIFKVFVEQSVCARKISWMKIPTCMATYASHPKLFFLQLLSLSFLSCLVPCSQFRMHSFWFVFINFTCFSYFNFF